ncbi:MAG: hypothetical protein P1S46_03770 [bacterium]|nr:hypothetical protein [bacterium]MDT8396373.1 hypothetical protein [bacterium]
MIQLFTSFIAGIRYFFMVAALALAVLALGSLGRGVMEVVSLAAGSGFTMRPGSGAEVIPYFIRAAFLYFLASAICSLFVAEPPVPQWMQVRNLFQFRVKVLTFVAVILPLAFMGRVMAADLAGPETLYSGAGVFLVLVGIFLLVRSGAPSGDDSMAREGTRPSEDRARSDSRAKPGKGPRGKEKFAGKEPGGGKTDDWLEKQKEGLRFQKESLGQVTDSKSQGEGGSRQDGSVTVRPGPRRPRGRRR